MTSQEAYDILLDTITNDLRHQDYEHVKELARYYRMLITGKGIEDELRQFKPREEDVMFEQRKQLTVATTGAVISSIKKPFNKVPRTPPVTRKITGKTDADTNAVAEINERVKNFYGADNNVGGLDYYLQNRFVDLSFKDPNAWDIIEFDPFDSNKQKPSPRPFEVSAEQAINFSVKNNLVEWLIIMLDVQFQVKDEEGKIYTVPGHKYTIYSDNDAWTFEQTSDDSSLRRVLQDPGEELVNIEGRGSFIVSHFETLTERCPAFRVGYIPDIETDGRTYVNPFHDALCYFKDLIKDGSEHSISKSCHVFQQKLVRLVKSCPGERGKGCIKGRTIEGNICGMCQGTGKPIHTSGQDIIEVELLGQADPEYIPLTDFVYYVPQPVEILKLQKEWIDDLEVKCHKTIFNSTALLRTSSSGAIGTSDVPIVKTATEQTDNMESVYDTLTPFAEKVSSVRVTIIEFIAILTDNKDKVIIIDRPATKFKLKSRQDLYSERRTLNDSGAPSFTIEAVDDELAQDIYADDAEGLVKYRVKKEHYPFAGKKPDEVAQLMASSIVLKKTKVLYAYFDDIFNELDREYKLASKDFYLEKVAVRQEKIDEKVQEIIDSLQEENATAFNFKMAALLPGAGNTNNNSQPTDQTAAA